MNGNRWSRARTRSLIIGAAAAGVVGGAVWGANPVSAGGSTPSRLAVRGGDGALWYAPGSDFNAPPFSGGYFPGYGAVIGTPAVVSVPHSNAEPQAPGTPYYVATGTDHKVWVRSETLGWQPLTPSTPPYCTSSPGATSVSAHAAGAVLLVVACRGGDGQLWYTAGQVSSDPSVLPVLSGWSPLGGAIVDGPAIAAVAPFTDVAAELTFFANGTDGRVWTRTLLTGWSPTAWSCIGHLAAAAQSATPLTVFACQGTNHSVWAATNAGSGWSGAFSLGGSVIDGPGVALSPNNWTVVAEGTDGATWENTSPLISVPGTSWSGWIWNGGVLTNGATAASLLYQNANP